MYCGHCGTAIPEGGLFCPQCGAKAEAPTQPDPVPVPVQESPMSEAPSAVIPPVPETASVPGETPASEETPAAEDLFFAEETPAKPKRSHKRLIFSLIAAVLVIALLAGGLVYAFVLNTPEHKLANAFENTYEDFLDLFDNCDNLKAVSKSVNKIIDSRQYFLGVELSGEIGDESFACTVELEQDKVAKRQSGEIALSAPDTMPDLNLSFYGDEEKLAFSIPALFENTYSIPTKDFGKKLLDSPLGELMELDEDDVADISLDLFAEFQWEDFIQKHSKEYKALKDSYQVTEVKEQIAGMPELTVYRVTLDWNAAGDLYRAFQEQAVAMTYGTKFLTGDFSSDSDEIFEELADAGLEIRIGVNDDNRVVAFHFSREDNQRTFTILLKGEDNPWHELVLLSDSETIAAAACEPTAKGPRFTFEADGDTITLECNDPEGVLTFSSEDVSLFSIRYARPKDGGAEVFAEIPIDGDVLYVTMLISPSSGVEPLSEAPTDLFSLSTTKLQMLVYEIYGNLQKLMQ